ncbi:MAG: hypothetical protein ABS944_16400 [Solibacillus sp.]|uniref:hypothetical protein n=1 Tax=Solibacillus sp. TaxID=1909654 RepID=UPI0033159FF3
MKFAQILYDKAHWIFEAKEKPDFAPNIILVDITGRNDIQEGWDYNSKTGEFTAPIISEPIPEESQPTIEEKILAENQYQTMLLELNSAGGI